MAGIPIRFKEALYDVSGYLVESLEGMSASIEGLFSAEHNDDGTHKSVNASAIMINGASVNALTAHPVTLTDCDNTTTPTNIASFTIDGNDMADGDQLTVKILAVTKENQGANQTFTLKLGWGATTSTLLSGISITDNAAEGNQVIGYTLFRERGVLYIYSSSLAEQLQGGTNWSGSDYTSMTPDFTLRSTVRFELTLSAADADFYLRPVVALVDHIRIV